MEAFIAIAAMGLLIGGGYLHSEVPRFRYVVAMALGISLLIWLIFAPFLTPAQNVAFSAVCFIVICACLRQS